MKTDISEQTLKIDPKNDFICPEIGDLITLRDVTLDGQPIIFLPIGYLNGTIENAVTQPVEKNDVVVCVDKFVLKYETIELISGDTNKTPLYKSKFITQIMLNTSVYNHCAYEDAETIRAVMDHCFKQIESEKQVEGYVIYSPIVNDKFWVSQYDMRLFKYVKHKLVWTYPDIK